MTNLLINPGFEMLWGGSRRCVVIVDGVLHIVDMGNIQCPQGWAVWFDLEDSAKGLLESAAKRPEQTLSRISQLCGK